MVSQDLCETEMRESLLRKQKELLELQQKKLELELLQTKARLQKQQVIHPKFSVLAFGKSYGNPYSYPNNAKK